MNKKGEGTLGYYQHSRMSYRKISILERDAYDDVTITARADGGGTHGEFSFYWINFQRHGTAIQMKMYGDAMWMLEDPRLNGLWQFLAAISPGHTKLKAMEPDEFTQHLERLGLKDFSEYPRTNTG